MEQEEIKKSIIERFNNLQPEIQEAIMNTNYENNINAISKKYNLTAEQTGDLELNTTLVLLGQTHPDEYQQELSNDLKIPEEKIEEILKDINEKIFKNIRALLINNFEEEEQDLDPNFSDLPENVQKAIADSAWKSKLYEIAGKYKLTISQMGVLEESTIKVMKGEIPADKYELELASKIIRPKEELANLIKDINNEILIAIRELLKNGERKYTPEVIQPEQKEEEIPLPPYSKPETTKIEIEKIPQPIRPIGIKNDTINTTINGDTPLPRSYDPYREQF